MKAARSVSGIWISITALWLIGAIFCNSSSIQVHHPALARMGLPLGRHHAMERARVGWHPLACAAVVGVVAQHALLSWSKRPSWSNLPASHWMPPATLVFLFGLSILFSPTGFALFI